MSDKNFNLPYLYDIIKARIDSNYYYLVDIPEEGKNQPMYIPKGESYLDGVYDDTGNNTGERYSNTKRDSHRKEIPSTGRQLNISSQDNIYQNNDNNNTYNNKDNKALRAKNV